MAELRDLRASDPVKLLAMYRHLAGLGVDNQLPRGVSFMSMIDALLDDEGKRRLVDPHDKNSANKPA